MSTPDYNEKDFFPDALMEEVGLAEESAETVPAETPAPKRISRKKKRRIRNSVLPFFLSLGILTGVAWCIPLRPTVSAREKRTLEPFPEFSLSALFSGEWFTGISVWFSDTFPGREKLVDVQKGMEDYYGDRTILIKGDIVVVTPKPTPVPEAPSTPKPTPVPEKEPEATPEPTPSPAPTSDPEAGKEVSDNCRVIGPALYIDDAGYELYNSSALASQTYSKTLSQAADKYAGRYRFFSMICPNSGGILLSYKTYDQFYPVRQGDAIEGFYVNRSENLIPVYVYDTLRAHNTEYLYFRTDHHWTALGAYYAYTEFCKAAGFEAVPLSAYTELTMDPFLGTYYQNTLSKEMKDNPDTVVAYCPPGKVHARAYNGYGVGSDIDVISDMRGKGSESQYLCFLGGDHYLTEITNDDIADDSAIIVVKDSYGNPFSVYLSQHYHTVLALDWHYELRLNELMNQYNVKDILVLTELIQAQGNAMLDNLYGDFLTYRGGV